MFTFFWLEELLVPFPLLEEDLPVSASSDDSTSFSAEDSIFLSELLDSSSQSLQIEDEESTEVFSSGSLLEAESSQPKKPITLNTTIQNNIFKFFII
jgi:hypothetical protein